ncbi:DUF2946 family protein [Stakelama tenebrarum]|uniref:DUF2946 domain-containing protein n=1 Tax=Stakelama tenebrarum TaxID=2711215 RepID=A0A6G6Y7F9_9SPHN|nr:DUF2946 family protein [Sphingosinithalassobacter tenebrarum]QIG80648.1 hypothetical protein G5C33_13240 [Sphingosinithalassobacter tenebrarum]
MGIDHIRTGLIGRVLRVLAFAAIALTAVVPPGFMPARAADNSMVISICTGTGPVTRVLTIEEAKRFGHSPDDQGQRDPRENCPFAGHQAPQQLPDLISPPAPSIAYVAYTPAPLTDFVRPGTGLSAPPPPSHAPPLHTV